MSLPWDRIEDLFDPLPEDADAASRSSVDEAMQTFGFGAVYADLQRMADDAQDRLNGQEDDR